MPVDPTTPSDPLATDLQRVGAVPRIKSGRLALGALKYDLGRKLDAITTVSATWEEAAERFAAVLAEAHPAAAQGSADLLNEAFDLLEVFANRAVTPGAASVDDGAPVRTFMKDYRDAHALREKIRARLADQGHGAGVPSTDEGFVVVKKPGKKLAPGESEALSEAGVRVVGVGPTSAPAPAPQGGDLRAAAQALMAAWDDDEAIHVDALWKALRRALIITPLAALADPAKLLGPALRGPALHDDPTRRRSPPCREHFIRAGRAGGAAAGARPARRLPLGMPYHRSRDHPPHHERRDTMTGADGWLPIKTAPRDGTPVDLWVDHRLSGKGFRITDCVYQRGWARDSRYVTGGRYRDENGRERYDQHREDAESTVATHWRLPPVGPSVADREHQAKARIRHPLTEDTHVLSRETGRTVGVEHPKFAIGDRVRKIRGSSWHGRIVGTYSTDLTPVGYCVESEREPGSVQIYPEAALEPVSC